jgi:hypothetical protein
MGFPSDKEVIRKYKSFDAKDMLCGLTQILIRFPLFYHFLDDNIQFVIKLMNIEQLVIFKKRKLFFNRIELFSISSDDQMPNWQLKLGK